MRKLALVLLVGSLLPMASAQASINVGLLGGLSVLTGDAFTNAKSPASLLGGELTWGIADTLEVGGFYEANFVSLQNAVVVGGTTETSGSGHFWGAVGRLMLPSSPIFVDVKLGWSSQSTGSLSSDNTFSWGVGGGYRITLIPTFLTLSPRVGYRHLPLSTSTPVSVSQSGGTWDFGLLAMISF